MNLQKILTILVLIIGLISITFLVMIISAGDEAVKAGESASTVTTFLYIAYTVLIATLAFVVIFSLKNIFTNSDVLKSTLRSVGIFALIAVICYFGLAKGQETILKDGEIFSEGGSQLLGAGLWLFYALILIAGGSIVFFGIKKMIR